MSVGKEVHRMLYFTDNSNPLELSLTESKSFRSHQFSGRLSKVQRGYSEFGVARKLFFVPLLVLEPPGLDGITLKLPEILVLRSALAS